MVLVDISLHTETKAGVKRRTSHEPNQILMRENKGFFSFGFDSAHVKYGVSPGPNAVNYTIVSFHFMLSGLPKASAFSVDDQPLPTVCSIL